MRLQKRIAPECLAHRLHLPNEESQIVDRRKAKCQNLACPEEMVEIRAIELGTRFTIAFLVDRNERFAMDACVKIDTAIRRKHRAVPCQTGRQHTIEHVDPLRHAIPEIFRDPTPMR